MKKKAVTKSMLKPSKKTKTVKKMKPESIESFVKKRNEGAY